MSSNIGSLPFNLTQQSSSSTYPGKSGQSYLGNKIQNPKVMVTNHGNDILGSH